MNPITLFKYFAGLCLLLFFGLGLRRIIYEVEDNKCEMTYMFEYPQYIKIVLPTEVKSKSPAQYGLYVYGEGEHAEKYQKGKFRGIPVLFLPGNAGSYKQVRSLASVAYRKALDSRRHFHFDFFAIDFNEELSALYGGSLDQQVSFAHDCIKAILSLYKSLKNPHQSVLLVGHSMVIKEFKGGMIAKAVFTLDDFDRSSVSTIITLATPHRHPVVATDEDMINFYSKVNQFWTESINSNSNIIVASIGGADRDIQVRSGLTAAHPPAVSVLTTEIPGVWLSADHLCIAWCKQVVKVVVRSLFDLVDLSTSRWIDGIEERKGILSYHLIERYGGKSAERSQPLTFTFDPDGWWRELIAPSFTAKLDPKDNRNTYFMIPLIDNAHRDTLVAIASHLPVKYWVFGCVANAWRNNARFCERGTDLSPRTLLLANTGDHVKRKLVSLSLVALREKGFSHVVFNLPKNQLQASIQIDVHRSQDRNMNVHFPLQSYIPLVAIATVVVPANALALSITLPDLTKSWQSVSMEATGLDCLAEASNALVRKSVPWSREGQFFLSNASISLQLHRPKTLSDGERESAQLQFINRNPQCRYEIKLYHDWLGMSAQLVRFYAPALLSMTTAIFLYCFADQLKTRASSAHVPSTLSCLLRLPVVKLAFILEGVSLVLGLIDSLHLQSWPFPPSDHFLLEHEGLSFSLQYLVLGGVAWALAILIAALFSLWIFVGGHALHSFVIRSLRSSFGLSSLLAELVTIGLSKAPAIISVALVVVAASTCGSLAIFLGLVICVWKMFEYYEDELESLLNDEERQDSDDSFNINTTMLLLWFCSALYSLPTLVVWSKNPSLHLPRDYTLIPSLVWSFFGMVAFQNTDFRQQGLMISYGQVSYMILGLSVMAATYGLISIYRIQYFVISAVAIYAVRRAI